MLALIYIKLRWARLTTRRYGWRALFTTRRPKHSGIGRGFRISCAQHGWGTPCMYLCRQIRMERMLLIRDLVTA